MDWITDFLSQKEQILHSLESTFYQLTRSNHLNHQYLSSRTANTELKPLQTFQETPPTQKLQIALMKDQLDLLVHQMVS
jgi:hypothetical protein